MKVCFGHPCRKGLVASGFAWPAVASFEGCMSRLGEGLIRKMRNKMLTCFGCWPWQHEQGSPASCSWPCRRFACFASFDTAAGSCLVAFGAEVPAVDSALAGIVATLPPRVSIGHQPKWLPNVGARAVSLTPSPIDWKWSQNDRAQGGSTA